MTGAPTLSLCMIVRNEERWIAQCLHSIHGLVSEIVVVDTGSTDRTPEIARQFGARVASYAWHDDFSAARNFSIEQATGDWIVVLDADEVIEPADHPTIRALIQRPQSPMFWLTQTTYCDESPTFGWIPNYLTVPAAQGYPGFVESRLVRLFRRIPEIRFQGRIHEHALHAQQEIIGAVTSVRIHHYGKYVDPEANAKKNALYLRLGEQKCRERPDDAQAFYEMGVQYLAMKQQDKAREMLERAVVINPDYVRPYVGLSCIATLEHRYADAVRNYIRVLELDPTNDVPYLYLPGILMDLGKVTAAEEILQLGEQYVAHQPTYHVNRGVVKQALGNYRASRAAFLRALELNPKEPLAWLNLGISCIELEEWELAHTALQKACAVPHIRLQALKRFGEYHFRRRDLDAALSTARQCHAEYPEDPDFVYQMAVVLIQQSRLAEARDVLRAMPNCDGFNTTQLKRLSACYRAVGEVAYASRLEARFAQQQHAV